MYCFHMASPGRIPIQLVIDHPVNVLIDKIAGAGVNKILTIKEGRGLIEQNEFRNREGR